MDWKIFSFIILAAFIYSIGNFFHNYASYHIGSFNIIILSRISGILFFSVVFIFLWLSQKSWGPLFLAPINQAKKKATIASLLVGILYPIVLLLIGFSFYYNGKSSTPINLGILTALFSLNFVITFIFDRIKSWWQGIPQNIYILDYIGILLIISGIIILGYQKHLINIFRQ